MEIEFNPSHTANPELVQPADRQGRLRRNGDEAPLEAFHSLEEKLKNLPAVRPDKVAQAQSLVEDVKYPPDEMLNRIAHLLAIRIQ